MGWKLVEKMVDVLAEKRDRGLAEMWGNEEASLLVVLMDELQDLRTVERTVVQPVVLMAK